MAVSTNCCLNLFPPPPVSTSVSSQISRTSEVSCPPKERSWKRQCVIGLTCAMIGLELGNLALVGNQDSAAIAGDMESSNVGSKIIRVQRWSDKRACQPWRLNSLETIVPENLPRPSARRRWENIDFPPEAPPLPLIVMPKSADESCFYL